MVADGEVRGRGEARGRMVFAETRLLEGLAACTAIMALYTGLERPRTLDASHGGALV